MTSTQLKAQIDAAITSKSQNNTITPSNVGVNIKAVVDYIDQEVDNIELTPGATGPAGPQGVAGPVGPAGLEWRGSWVSGTPYVADDAVGYGGASYFCILATSGTTTPNLATANWALLASQGSPGIAGPQGPPGAGVAAKTTAVLLSSGSSAPFPYSTADFAKFVSTSPYALPPAPVLGEVRHILTTASSTLWASPNPGNDGSNNNFITSDGNGNSSMTLLANKSYRFTYIGRYGGTYGFWTVEIMNNI
jgi:hypothetical protein